MSTRKIPADQLEIGMYVSELDRPWLETPFLFQGFCVRAQDEIEEIQAHCEYVYVDFEQGLDAHSIFESRQLLVKKPDKTPRPSPKPSARDSTKNIVLPRSTRKKNDRYKATVALKTEIKRAKDVHQKTNHTVRKVIQTLREAGNLDMTVLQKAIRPMIDSVLRNPAALACLVRMQRKDDYLYEHSLACSLWATILGRQLGLARQDLNVVALGAMLIDIGKTKLPSEVLSKPCKLTDQEERIMKDHVAFGLDMLQDAGSVDPRIVDMVAHHHERYDGSGYPKGISGNAIPVFGRIAGIVDAYDAMITPRPYADLLSSYEALRRLQLVADIEFQAELIDQFTQAIGAFPTGTLVELNTGEVAIVTKQNRVHRLRPEVMVIIDADGNFLDEHPVIDLGKEEPPRHSTYKLWIERGLPPGARGIDVAEFYLT